MARSIILPIAPPSASQRQQPLTTRAAELLWHMPQPWDHEFTDRAVFIVHYHDPYGEYTMNESGIFCISQSHHMEDTVISLQTYTSQLTPYHELSITSHGQLVYGAFESHADSFRRNNYAVDTPDLTWMCLLSDEYNRIIKRSILKKVISHMKALR